MTSITQQPAPLSVKAVAGDPFALLLKFTLTDPTGATIPWSSVSAPVVTIVDEYQNPITGVLPTVASPATGQFLLSWTAPQTTLLNAQHWVFWGFAVTIGGVGPLALLAGQINMTPNTQPGSPSNFPSSTTATVAVDVGTTTATIAVTTSGGIVTEVDGGFANSTYLSSQSLDGGSA